MNTIIFEIKRNRKSIIIWSIALMMTSILCLVLYPSMRDGGLTDIMSVKLDAMPQDVLKAFNIDKTTDFSNLGQYIAYIIQYVAIGIAVYSINVTAKLIAAEEIDGSIEFLYARPISRKAIFIKKLITAFLSTLIVIFFTGLSILITAICVNGGNMEIFDLILEIKTMMLGVLIIAFVFISITVLLASTYKFIKNSSIITVGILCASYLLGILSKLNSSFENLKYLSIFEYFEFSNLIKNGFEINYIIISVLVMIVCIILSLIFYQRRDYRI